MSYLAVSLITKDEDLLARVTACAAIEGDAAPELWTQQNKWAIAAQPLWGDAWEYAVNSGVTDIGTDPGVITDGMILSAVQSLNNIKPRPATPTPRARS